MCLFYEFKNLMQQKFINNAYLWNTNLKKKTKFWERHNNDFF